MKKCYEGMQLPCSKISLEKSYAESEVRYLALGNSIVLAPEMGDGSWQGWYGMAASEASKDYVFGFSAKLFQRFNVKTTAVCIASWERKRFSDDGEAMEKRGEILPMLDIFLEENPDLITVQLGENVTDVATFEEDYGELLDYLGEKAPGAKIILIDSFWDRPGVLEILKRVAERYPYPFIDLKSLRESPERYQAGIGARLKSIHGGEYTINSVPVASHPGDEAFAYYAERLYEIWLALGGK